MSSGSLEPGPARGASRPVIGEEGVRHIAELARLEVTPEEVPELARHFDRILDFVDTLRQADVDGVEPYSHPERPLADLRADEMRQRGVAIERVFANAPNSDESKDDDARYFVTPRVV